MDKIFYLVAETTILKAYRLKKGKILSNLLIICVIICGEIKNLSIGAKNVKIPKYFTSTFE